MVYKKMPKVVCPLHRIYNPMLPNIKILYPIGDIHFLCLNIYADY